MDRCVSIKAAFTLLQHSVIKHWKGELSFKSLWQFVFCFLGKNSCQVCVCIPLAHASFWTTKQTLGGEGGQVTCYQATCPVWHLVLLCSVASFLGRWSSAGARQPLKAHDQQRPRKPGGAWGCGFLTLIWESCALHVSRSRENSAGMMNEWLTLLGLQIQVTNLSIFPDWLVGLSTQDYLSSISC